MISRYTIGHLCSNIIHSFVSENLHYIRVDLCRYLNLPFLLFGADKIRIRKHVECWQRFTHDFRIYCLDEHILYESPNGITSCLFFLINKSSSCFINTSTKNLLSVSLCDILVFNFHFGVKADLGYIFSLSLIF